MESGMQQDNKSTMLDSLPQQGQDDGQQKLVQEILQEIKDDQPPNQQEMQQQYQMDPNVNMGVSGQVPNEDEIREMQQMQQMQQMQEQQMQEQMLTPPQKSVLEKIMDNSKETILVAVLYLLISQPFLNSTLSKIPKFLTETGDVSMIGLLVKSVLASLIFLAVKTFVL